MTDKTEHAEPATELDTSPEAEAAETGTETETDRTEPSLEEAVLEARQEAEQDETEAGDEPEPEPKSDSDSDSESDPEPEGDANTESDADDEAEPAKKPSSRRGRSSSKPASDKAASERTKKAPAAAAGKPVKKQMLITYVPGEECRVAILEDGILEEYHAERPATANRVGNLYLGKVTNVESSLQAAFVDFGMGENAFLHTSDLHPRYFPSEDGDTTEKIGKKTPRRERPPIQHCLKRGQKIVVQIMKDGVGTKGPACTSYLSIPGRYLVMMPQMDNVGVSRKVDDEDMRKKMRKILDQLELPEHFGFILRTAGFDKTKTELKRDLSYLQRLWKNIEKAQKGSGKPRLLYAESDLLVRTLRDLLTKDIDEVIIDHEQGLARAANFLKVVAPRSATSLLHYNLPQPMFHAYGLEDRVRQLHSREVPLPSGGRLVIDETEALVAIDVNSGKSRKAKDAESNAFNTNMEAVDEICRQMKLRELGGLVINDLIDMNQAKNRKAIEARFKERLKNDRAKSTVLPISEFGILELTRQRMRASATMTHFQELPAAYGRGWIRKADSVAADAMRELRLILSYDKVKKVELIVPGRVAGDLLSVRRRALTKLEILTGKHIDVRISDSLGSDRYTIYAYDEVGNDVAIERLPKPKPPKSLPTWEVELDEAAFGDDEQTLLEAIEADTDAHPIEEDLPPAGDDDENEGRSKKKRRRRRKRKSDDNAETTESLSDETETNASPDEAGGDGDEAQTDGGGETGGKKKRRRRRRRRRGSGEDGETTGETQTDGESADNADRAQPEGGSEAESAAESESDSETGGKKKRRRRRRGGSKRNDTDPAEAPTAPEPAPAAAAEPKPPAKKKPKLLYAASRRKLKPSEKAALGED
ncbi:MAG: Rne/Rng family ribonuclease [Planctomycetota bacterium]